MQRFAACLLLIGGGSPNGREVCMKQAARLEQMHEDLDKACFLLKSKRLSTHEKPKCFHIRAATLE